MLSIRVSNCLDKDCLLAITVKQFGIWSIYFTFVLCLPFHEYRDTWARGERANWGGANMLVRGGHFWQLTSLATETTGGVILVAPEAISECLI